MKWRYVNDQNGKEEFYLLLSGNVLVAAERVLLTGTPSPSRLVWKLREERLLLPEKTGTLVWDDPGHCKGFVERNLCTWLNELPQRRWEREAKRIEQKYQDLALQLREAEEKVEHLLEKFNQVAKEYEEHLSFHPQK